MKRLIPMRETPNENWKWLSWCGKRPMKNKNGCPDAGRRFWKPNGTFPMRDGRIWNKNGVTTIKIEKVMTKFAEKSLHSYPMAFYSLPWRRWTTALRRWRWGWHGSTRWRRAPRAVHGFRRGLQELAEEPVDGHHQTEGRRTRLHCHCPAYHAIVLGLHDTHIADNLNWCTELWSDELLVEKSDGCWIHNAVR